MSRGGTLTKPALEKALYEEKQEISSGRLKEENPLDLSPEFQKFCEACRRGDLKTAQEQISLGVNINARDEYDYTPLILASLCGHYEVAQTLLEQGALCERDTFQGERCLYNALNDRIRNLLLQYDYSKSSDPLQPLAAHVSSLLSEKDAVVKTSDITVYAGERAFALHKFLLSARSPYFARKLAAAPETTTWRLSSTIPGEAFETCIRYLYMAEVGADLGEGEEARGVLAGIDKLSRQLEIPQVFEDLLASGDRRQARHRRTAEVERARDQLAVWFEGNVVGEKIEVETSEAETVKWDRDNSVFADVLLRADLDDDDAQPPEDARTTEGHSQPQHPRKPQRSILYPTHRSLLLRSDFFHTMFASPFREAQPSVHLPIIPIDCSPEVLEHILRFLYTEQADFPLSVALDVLTAADMLFIEKLKQRAALLISTLGSGGGEEEDGEELDIYEVIRTGWSTRVHRLEEFGARYIAYRLERYISEPEFRELVQESAGRIQGRQETDTVELVDDIRYYLSERFRLRFEDAGLEGMMDESGRIPGHAAQLATGHHVDAKGGEEAGKGVHVEKGEEEERGPIVRTLDGEIAGDEFAQDAINYQILLGKIEGLMEGLGLDG